MPVNRVYAVITERFCQCLQDILADASYNGRPPLDLKKVANDYLDLFIDSPNYEEMKSTCSQILRLYENRIHVLQTVN